jgi:hypothetical protein
VRWSPIARRYRLRSLFGASVSGDKNPVPYSTRKIVGVVANPRNPNTTTVLQQTEVAVRNLGLRAEVVEARVGEELESAFAALSTKHVEGIVLIPEPFMIEHRVWIAFAGSIRSVDRGAARRR